MSILIKGMEMPKRCGECPLSLYPHSPCWKNGGALDWENRPSWCPLVEVPPHRDLIDRDKLIESVSEETCDCNPDHFDLDDKGGYGKWMLHNGINTGIVAARVRIKGAPTIIEAEEGEM